MSGGGGKRSRLSSKAVLAVWVRSGGRCMLCNAYLLEGTEDVRLRQAEQVRAQEVSRFHHGGPRRDPRPRPW
ncbi:hypothetical protein FHX80_111384 [Streptomyces brevispora]|uniref:Uncharacterized protein n=1 Tax=Streptomyces brevispora TaxID=887462 RepID=A0A561UUD1_9ACTN|nr:hypothetical protein FHX80_111384 [Streptomyces brevispora]